MVRIKKDSVLPALDGLLLFAMLATGLVAMLSLLDAVTSSALSQFRVGLPTEPLGSSLPAGVTLQEAEGLVRARTGLGYRLAWWFVGPASALVVLAGAHVLRGIVATARAGDPFVGANVSRLRTLGALTIGYFALSAGASFVAVAIQSGLDFESVRTTMSFAPLAWALLLFALAEIWQRGVDLRDEQALTV